MKIFDETREFLDKNRQDGRKCAISIVGPTASGKTALGIYMAKLFDGEVISADSRQIYRYMDIGTDKITPEKMQGVPHHLIDLFEPDKECTVSEFKRLALKAINDIHSKKKIPVMCGGTGLYINVITQNYQIPSVAPDFSLRQDLAMIYKEKGAENLHNILREMDPETAQKIHPNNVRYVIRALEIAMAGHKKEERKGELLFENFFVGIDWPREILYQRINDRVDEMMERGLLNELKTMLMKGYNKTMPSMSSLGYSELIEFLEGHVTLDQAVEKIKQNTRNFCKRQQTWFRRNSSIHWIEGSELENYLKQTEDAKKIMENQE